MVSSRMGTHPSLLKPWKGDSWGLLPSGYFVDPKTRPLAWAGLTARLRRCTQRSLRGAARATFPDLRCHTWGSLIS